MGDLLSVKEACRYLGISRPQLYVLMGTGRLKWIEIEGMRGRRFERSDLDALKREHGGRR